MATSNSPLSSRETQTKASSFTTLTRGSDRECSLSAESSGFSTGEACHQRVEVHQHHLGHGRMAQHLTCGQAVPTAEDQHPCGRPGTSAMAGCTSASW